MGIHHPQRTELAIQKTSNQAAKRRFVFGKTKAHKRNTALFEGARKQLCLCSLAGAINALNNNQLSASHGRSV